MIRSFRTTALAGLLAVLIVPAIASAQTVVGIKGGLTFTTVDFHLDGIDDEVVPGFDRKPGVAAGLFVGREFNDVFGLQVEALYTQKKTEAKDFDIEGLPIDATFRLDYIEIPVLAQLRVAGRDQAALRLYGGPSVAFKVTETVEFDGVESDEDAGLKSYDAGIVVGASVTAGRFVIDGRYTHGLVNIEDEDPDFVTAKTRTFAVLVGWRF